jgi:hypothetical protein
VGIVVPKAARLVHEVAQLRQPLVEEHHVLVARCLTSCRPLLRKAPDLAESVAPVVQGHRALVLFDLQRNGALKIE